MRRKPSRRLSQNNFCTEIILNYYSKLMEPHWAFWVIGLALLGFTLGADKHHDWRDLVGPLIVLASIIIAYQQGQWEVASAILLVLALKMATR
jgi:hypothetical protein